MIKQGNSKHSITALVWCWTDISFSNVFICSGQSHFYLLNSSIWKKILIKFIWHPRLQLALQCLPFDRGRPKVSNLAPSWEWSICGSHKLPWITMEFLSTRRLLSYFYLCSDSAKILEKQNTHTHAINALVRDTLMIWCKAHKARGPELLLHHRSVWCGSFFHGPAMCGRKIQQV